MIECTGWVAGGEGANGWGQHKQVGGHEWVEGIVNRLGDHIHTNGSGG